MSDFNITLFEACEILNKSKKTISRYIRQGKLHPQEVKSQCGTLEYRFTRLDLDTFRQDGTRQDRTGQTGQNDDIKENGITNINLEETRQDTEDRTDGTRKTGQKKEIAKIPKNQEETGRDRTGQDKQDNEIITLLKKTTGVLRDQLTIKDKQIESLSGKIDQLIERSRETNILIKGLQDKILLLETPKEPAYEPVKKICFMPVKTGKNRTAIKQEPDLINNNKIPAEIEGNKDNNKRNAVKQGKQEKRGFFKKLFG